MLADAEAQMAFAAAYFSGRAIELEPRGQEERPTVFGPIGFQPVQVLEQSQRQGAERDLGVDHQLRRRGAGLEMFGGIIAEMVSKGVDRIRIDFETGSGGMAAVADKVVAASLQGFMQREAGNRSAGALADDAGFATLLAKADQEHGAGMEIDQAAGD